MKKNFKISTVMPIYNVEKYLEEAIESVVNQTIGFEDNIQLILVNDGSPDDSEEICLKYKETYPDNVTYIKQENAGVSAARNRGKLEVKGKYINFFDSDDVWKLDSYEIMYDFFEEHYDEIDLVSCKLRFFGNHRNNHPLNFKYAEDAVIDINEQPDFIQLSASSALIKSEALMTRDFDTSLAFSEDALLLTLLIMEKQRYGVVSEAVYYYRRREEGNSAIQQSVMSLEWYFDTPEKSYKYLMKESKKRYGKVLDYIQSYVMYDIQWRLKVPFPDMYSEEIRSNYVDVITALLQNIDDDIILAQKDISSEYKLYALELKKGHSVNEDLYLEGKDVYYGDYRVHSLVKRAPIKVNILTFKKGILTIEGQFSTLLPYGSYELYAVDSERNIYPIALKPSQLSEVLGIDRVIWSGWAFNVAIPVHESTDIQVFLKYKDYAPIKLRYMYYQHSKLSNRYKLAYYQDDKVIYNVGPYIIRVIKRNFITEVRNRLRTNVDLIKHGKYKAVILKLLTAISSPFIKKPVWLISDRLSFANDNGYHLFKYISEQHNSDVNAYFVLDKNSEDYAKMKKIGKVVPYKSLRYDILFLLSNKVISSSGEDWVINPFKGGREMYKGFYTFDFVFLQHGITINDLSKWLNKLSKNIGLFVTVTNPEYDSIVNGDYGYSENEVKLVGFPRYDNLVDESSKKIVIMPTWRKSIATNEFNDIAGERNYNPLFKESDYFKFYNKLINDSRLLSVLEKHGYTGEFVVHPSHLKQDIDFEGNNVFSINSGFADYQTYFRESSLLITDYSSVSMDFAYLNKPVIYTQFDKEDFYGQHTYTPGYFDYEDHGFGPVCYDLDTTVDTIIKTIERDCKQEQKYEDRVKDFYKYNDRKNCERVYDAILEMD